MRGDSRKLTVMRCRFDLRKYCFTNQINMWNSLPDNVILADNVNQFKNRLDKHWKMHDIHHHHITWRKRKQASKASVSEK